MKQYDCTENNNRNQNLQSTTCFQSIDMYHSLFPVFLPSEWHYHPATGLHFIRPLVGQGVGEAAVQRQRQYDVGKLFHRGDKDSGKWRENEMNGGIFYAEEGEEAVVDLG